MRLFLKNRFLSLSHLFFKINIMKVFNKFFMTLLLSFAFFTTGSYAQSHNHVIKANPIALAFGNFNVTYEKVISPSSSLLFSGSYMYKLLGEDITAAGVGAGYRYYITNKKLDVPAGFHVTPQAALAFGKTDASSITTLSIGAEIGYQWVMKSGFAIDLGIGPNYALITGDNTLKNTSGVIPSLTLAIGYAF